jgi:peptidyl-prolyl cis-trans isomerase D
MCIKKQYFAAYFTKMAKNKNQESGVIMKIQKQTGCLLIVIGAAMLAFVLTDLLKSGPSVFSGNQNVVGEIAGEKISYEDYSRKVEDLKQFYLSDLGGQGEDEQFRDMAWNQLIVDKIEKREHDALGIKVGPEEFKDITTGDHTDESIIQAFQNQDTKEFSRNQLINFLEVQMQEDERKYRIWYNYYEIPLRERLEREKYDKLVKNGIYVTKLDAREDFDREHFELSAMAVGIPYSTIEDSTISFDDDDLKSYLNKNSSKYQQEASRDIEFVVINVFPNDDDTLRTKKWAEDLVDKFKATKKDSLFVRSKRSNVPFDPEYKRHGSFPPNVEDMLFDSDTNVVIGPIYNAGTYSLYKVTGIKEDSLSSMRARHVLISLADASSGEEGLQKARTLMSKIRSGAASFEESAKNNYDGTGASNGDLGWVTETGPTNLIDDLRVAIFKHNKGDWFVLKSSNGYHVIEITAGKSKKLIQVAVVGQDVIPGTKVDELISRKAADIQYEANENDDFMAVVEEQDQRVREATEIKVENPTIPGISNTREIVRWLFDNKTEVGSISDVIDLQDRYVVAKCQVIRIKGTSTLEDVRESLTAAYILSKKAEILNKQLVEALELSQDADSIAKNLNTVVRLMPTMTMFSPQVTGIGPDPAIHGAIFGLPEGQHSGPIEGINGVYVVWNTGQVTSLDQEYDEEEAIDRLRVQTEQMADALVRDALRAKGDIVDNRYRFY